MVNVQLWQIVKIMDYEILCGAELPIMHLMSMLRKGLHHSRLHTMIVPTYKYERPALRNWRHLRHNSE